MVNLHQSFFVFRVRLQFLLPNIALIVASLCCIGALGGGLGHYFFDFGGVAGEAFAQEFIAGFGDEYVVFDADAQILFGDVDAWLHGDDHAGLERFAVVAGIMDIEANIVAEAVNVIFAERISVQILSVGIDVVVGNFVQALASFLAHIHSGLDGGHGGVLGA